jgi:hypothetical protein
MKKTVLYFASITSLLSLVTAITFAQDKAFPFQARNAIYGEVGGINQVYSLNFDRLVLTTPSQAWLIGYRVGGSLAGKQLVRSRLVGEIYALFGEHNSHLEIGIGTSLGRNWSYDKSPYGGSLNMFVSPIVAYRFQPPGGISFFRVSISPSITINSRDNRNSHGYPIGIGFGRSF